MQAVDRRYSSGPDNRELIGLALASIACVAVLTVSVAESRGHVVSGLAPQVLLFIAILAGAVAVAFGAALLTARHALAAARSARREAEALREGLVLAESIVKSEPQVVVVWEPGQELKVATNTIEGIAGLPTGQADLLRFGSWLEPASADALKSGLDGLFRDGRPFAVLLKTKAGADLEADGRATGARAMLRLRDVAAYKRDLVQLSDQHRRLTGDLAASRDMLDALPMPVWTSARDGRIAWANRCYVRAVEARDLAEVCERQIELLELRERKAMAAALAKGQAFAKRIQLVVHGERVAHDVSVVAVGGLTHAVAVDVSQVEKAKSELSRQLATYDRTLDRVRTAAAVFDHEHRLTFFNEGFARLWQLDASWLEGKPTDSEILDRLHGLTRLPGMADYRAWKSGVLACFANGQGYDDWWQLPDGRLLHVIGEQRHDGGVAFLYDDATERMALESRYNALIDVQRETLDSMKQAVAVFGADGKLKLFNSAFGIIWPVSLELLTATPHITQVIAEARKIHDDPRAWARLARVVTAVSDEREAVSGQMVRADQSVIDYATTPLPDGGNLITFIDVTASKRYERALEERNEALVAADRLKNQVIGNVSYELRTPLTTIIGFTDMLSNPLVGALVPRQQEYLSYISSSSAQLLAIIDDILDLANIDAGMLQLKLAPVSAKAIIDGAILGVRERAMQARLTIDISCDEDDIEFIADEARVRQVIYNLLSNAVGFSRTQGTVRIALWREQGMVAFAVEDHGVGIPKEEQRRVFERFERNSHGSNHRGAGLGLSIVKSLVDLHHGDMKLESEPERGTRVTVRFPEQPVAQAPDDPARAKPAEPVLPAA